MARFNLVDPRDYLEALTVLNQAKEGGYELEISRPKKPRTLKQNAYYWLLIEYFACVYGCTKTEAAEHYFKELCNPDIFVRTSVDKKTGECYKYRRSTTEIDKQTMTSAIRNWIEWCAMNGIELPQENDYIAIKYCEREIEKHKNYL